MKLNLNSFFTAKALAAFAVLMSLFYLGGGLFFLFLGLYKADWQWTLLGTLFLFYGSFRAYRTYQNYRNENT